MLPILLNKSFKSASGAIGQYESCFLKKRLNALKKYSVGLSGKKDRPMTARADMGRSF